MYLKEVLSSNHGSHFGLVNINSVPKHLLLYKDVGHKAFEKQCIKQEQRC